VWLYRRPQMVGGRVRRGSCRTACVKHDKSSGHIPRANSGQTNRLARAREEAHPHPIPPDRHRYLRDEVRVWTTTGGLEGTLASGLPSCHEVGYLPAGDPYNLDLERDSRCVEPQHLVRGEVPWHSGNTRVGRIRRLGVDRRDRPPMSGEKATLWPPQGGVGVTPLSMGEQLPGSGGFGAYRRALPGSCFDVKGRSRSWLP
jgi:hypothetical protein